MKSMICALALLAMSGIASAQVTQQQADAAKASAQYWANLIPSRSASSTALEEDVNDAWLAAIAAEENCVDMYWHTMGDYQMADGNTAYSAGDAAAYSAVVCTSNGFDEMWDGNEDYTNSDWAAAKAHYDDAIFWNQSAVFQYNTACDEYLDAEEHFITAKTLYIYGL